MTKARMASTTLTLAKATMIDEIIPQERLETIFKKTSLIRNLTANTINTITNQRRKSILSKSNTMMTMISTTDVNKENIDQEVSNEVMTLTRAGDKLEIGGVEVDTVIILKVTKIQNEAQDTRIQIIRTMIIMILTVKISVMYETATRMITEMTTKDSTVEKMIKTTISMTEQRWNMEAKVLDILIKKKTMTLIMIDKHTRVEIEDRQEEPVVQEVGDLMVSMKGKITEEEVVQREAQEESGVTEEVVEAVVGVEVAMTIEIRNMIKITTDRKLIWESLNLTIIQTRTQITMNIEGTRALGSIKKKQGSSQHEKKDTPIIVPK
jgi:hypothetical protein